MDILSNVYIKFAVVGGVLGLVICVAMDAMEGRDQPIMVKLQYGLQHAGVAVGTKFIADML